MQLALYRSERPEVFEEIIGQKQIVKILQNQIKTGTVSQAYLFAGTHGTGKTTTARILAKALNCLEEGNENIALPCGRCENCEAIREGRFVDVIELDAASNNGVDDIRAIIDIAQYPPTIGKYKVFIIDEVHMLSQGAENAFLKTLEEPPEYAIFILATTDPEKVRETIRSRCMELNFKRVSEEELISGMRRICERKSVKASDEALRTISSKADGSVRDALSILEQCMAVGDEELTRSMVLEYTGSAGEDFYLALTAAVVKGELGKALIYIDEIIKRGKDAKQLLKDWLEHYRNLMIVKYVSRAERVINASAENIGRLKEQADYIDIAAIERAIRLISEYINIGRYSDRPRIILETVAVRLAGRSDITEASELGSRLRISHSTRSGMSGTGNGMSGAGSGMSGAGNAANTLGTGRQEDRTSSTVNADEEASEEPIIISPLPREEAGDADDMWERIVEELGRYNEGFDSMVGRHSCAESYKDGELIVRIKKNRLSFAEEKLKEINSIAKKIYGSNTVVNIKAGNIDKAVNAEPSAAKRTEETQSEKVAETPDVENLTENISNLFGMDVKVVE